MVRQMRRCAIRFPHLGRVQVLKMRQDPRRTPRLEQGLREVRTVRRDAHAG